MGAAFVVWFTGPPASGKSTLSCALVERLRARGVTVARIDGDLVRRELSPELGYSRSDRERHLQRVGAQARERFEAGEVVVAALVSPYADSRAALRSLFPRGHYLEVYCHCPFDVLVQRDPKGLYGRALAGEIHHFTGVDDPYETPVAPELTLRTDVLSLRESVERVWALLVKRRLLSQAPPAEGEEQTRQ